MASLDLLAFSPHPDDAELFCGGLLAKAKREGYSTGVVDLTEGELSTRGNVELRKTESARASGILRLDWRSNLGMPDGNLANIPEHRIRVIQIVRQLRPKLCLLPYWYDRHPDHEAAALLTRMAVYQAGLEKISDGHDVFRPRSVLYYMLHRVFVPTFVVDITEDMDVKMAAIRAYPSQFSGAGGEKDTYISRPEFIESIITRARFYGQQINCTYGEPYFFDGMLKIDNVMDFFAYTRY